MQYEMAIWRLYMCVYVLGGGVRCSGDSAGCGINEGTEPGA